MSIPTAEMTTESEKRHQRWLIAGVLVLVVAGGVISWMFRKDSPPVRKAPASNVVQITLPPPPPPPPPPPKVEEPPPVPEEKTEQFIAEEAPTEEPPDEPAPADEPPAALATNTPEGPPDGFGLRRGGAAGVIGGTGRGAGGRSRSQFGWYAGQVQSTVSDALRRNPRTRKAAMSVKVHVWPDASGRIARARLAGSSGDPALDQAIQREVLQGLQLKSAPPEGMPLPIVMKLTARRPD